MPDASQVGLELDEVTFPVERGKVREFARALHIDDPVHQDAAAAEAAGFDAIPAPLTFAMVAMMWRDRDAAIEDLGFDLKRLLHGGVTWEYRRPGDFNPIHHDEQFARDAGLETVFAIGMLPAGLLSGFVADWLGLANVRSFGVRFTGQVWPDDTLTLAGTVDRVYEQDGDRLADCSFSVTRQNGDVALTATATAAVA